MKALPLAVLAALGAAPLAAQTYRQDAMGWIDDGKALPHPKQADIGIPRATAGLHLIELGNFGTVRDVEAQYASNDRQIDATVYIYETGAPDALLTKLITDRVIAVRYGPQTRRASDTVVTAGGQADAAYRSVFADGASAPGSGFPAGPLITAAVYLHTASSNVKLRITGPQAKREEIEADLDQLLAALQFADKAKPVRLGHSQIDDCSAPPSDAATAIPDKLPSEAVIGAGLLLMGGDAPPVANRPALCIVAQEQSPNGIGIVVRTAGLDDGRRKVLIGDAGSIVIAGPDNALDPAGKRTFVTYRTTGVAAQFGPFDRLPSSAQLLSIGTGNTDWLGEPLVVQKFTPNGDSNVQYFSDRMIDAKAEHKK